MGQEGWDRKALEQEASGQEGRDRKAPEQEALGQAGREREWLVPEEPEQTRQAPESQAWRGLVRLRRA